MREQAVKERLWTRDFILITAINCMVFCSFQMFPTAISPYLHSLGAGDAVLGWIAAGVCFGTIIVRPFAGRALDKVGRHPVLLTGILIILLATFGHWAASIPLLFVVRAVHGLGFGFSNTASNTVASEIMPRSRFGEGMGYFGLFGTLAMAISPAIALSMLPTDGAPISMTPIIFTATGFIGVALVLSFFVRYQPVKRRQPGEEPAPKGPMYEKSAYLPATILFLITSTFGAVVTFLALYAAQKGIGNIGLFFSVYSIVLVFTRPLVGKFVDLRGYGAAVLPGVTLIIISLLVLGLASSYIWFLASAAFMGAGQGATQTSAQTMAVAGAPRHRLGAANATYFTGFDAGMGMGALFAGSIAALVGYEAMFAGLAVLPALAGLLYLYSTRRRKRQL